MRIARLRDLPIVWKILLPFLVLILVVGVLGTVFVVRDLRSRGELALDADLSQRALVARAAIHERELYLLEAVDFAANVTGMSDAVAKGDASAVRRLLASVQGLKSEVAVAAILDRGAAPIAAVGIDAASTPVVDGAAFVTAAGQTLLAISAPVCGGATDCSPVGTAIVGIEASRLLDSTIDAGLFDGRGAFLAGSALLADARVPDAARSGSTVRARQRSGATELAVLYAPLQIRGRRLGTLALSRPTAGVLASARAAGLRLALTLLAVMAGIVAIALLLSRTTVARLRDLVRTNKALGSGDLSARAQVSGRDELGELAAGVNEMADRLQTIYATLEDRVDERTAEVQRLLRERNELFTALSHDLRTPLAVVRGQARLQADESRPKSAAWIARSGRTIEAAADQLLRLVDDIMTLAQAETGTLGLELTEVDLADVMATLRPTMKSLASEAGLRLSEDVRGDLPPVRADRGRFEEVVLNLFSNAVKYTPRGGRVGVSAAAVKRRHLVEIAVSDTGLGIPDDVGDHVFEPFYTVKANRPQAGQPSSGLGLALAKQLVETQGGTITFKSAPGKGTTFTFTIPTANGTTR
jgi:signal transduction histidine kinase